MIQDKSLYSLLAYAGALPFVACAVLPLMGLAQVANVGTFDYIARVYGLAIVSFVAGSHWGTYLYNRESCPTNLFIASNVVVVAVWLAFLLTIPSVVLFVLLLAFLYLLFVDYTLHDAGLTSGDYLRVRAAVTLIVSLSLVTNIALLAF